MGKIVLALGGNALGSTPTQQRETVKGTAVAVADLLEAGDDLIIVHGNGPQVGMINLAMSIAAGADSKIPSMPYPECGAMSQGYIGYHLQQAIGNELARRGILRNAVTLITQVIVDRDDPAFADPSKPVGRFYTKEDAERISKETGDTFKEDAGRGWRRVIASPEPVRIVEIDTIKRIFETGDVIIAAGGGGIPLAETADGTTGVAAVIDKDKSASKIASELSADVLMILTAVEKVCLDFNSENQREIDSMTAEEARKYIEDGHFAPGSMLPKVEACISFLKANPAGKAIISSLSQAGAAIEGKTGTVIYA